MTGVPFMNVNWKQRFTTDFCVAATVWCSLVSVLAFTKARHQCNHDHPSSIIIGWWYSDGFTFERVWVLKRERHNDHVVTSSAITSGLLSSENDFSCYGSFFLGYVATASARSRCFFLATISNNNSCVVVIIKICGRCKRLCLLASLVKFDWWVSPFLFYSFSPCSASKRRSQLLSQGWNFLKLFAPISGRCSQCRACNSFFRSCRNALLAIRNETTVSSSSLSSQPHQRIAELLKLLLDVEWKNSWTHNGPMSMGFIYLCSRHFCRMSCHLVRTL